MRRTPCRPQVEVEIWPARTELYFRDEPGVNPINKQVRLEAAIYNSRGGVRWEVRNPADGPGSGLIDSTGLYRAPNKGPLADGSTEIAIATANDDPLRKAFAWITLLGRGPAPAVQPKITLLPRRAQVYYPQGFQNDHIDESNRKQLFQATVRDGGGTIEWLVNGVVQGVTGPWFLFEVTGGGGAQVVTIRARLQAQPAIFDEAKVLKLNYSWPGM